MIWNKHSDLEGNHAFLGASKYHWSNYDDEKLSDSYKRFLATTRGTELHEFAASCIRLKQKLPRSNKTLNMYVNDCLHFHMQPEQLLYFSDNCYGTADAISFEEGMLRIHDLKTGEIPAHMEQLMIYAALFCLEYKVKPKDISSELRIYQANEVLYHNPEPAEIEAIIAKIITFDRLINKIKAQEA